MMHYSNIPGRRKDFFFLKLCDYSLHFSFAANYAWIHKLETYSKHICKFTNSFTLRKTAQ